MQVRFAEAFVEIRLGYINLITVAFTRTKIINQE